MISSMYQLPITRQCQLLSLSRSTAYYQAKGISNDDLEIMRRLDEMHLKRPFYGSRRLRDWLMAENIDISRKRVQRLMRILGITAIYPKKNTSAANKKHKIYPYLLRNLEINRANQVFCTDITYIPMAKGFVYLIAVMDWHTRKILSWRLSNTMDTHFCVEALEEAIEIYGAPEIFNTDQGSQFTSDAFTSVLKDNHIKISMDGKGCWVDNVMIERFWRSLKYEEVYLKAYNSVKQARQNIGEYIEFYNTERKHQSLEQTPDQAYYGQTVLPKAA